VPAAAGAAEGANQPEIRTPKPPVTPRINGPSIFGVRPGSPFLFHIPATGERPMGFSAEGLPAGLQLDAQSGEITGSLNAPGRHLATLRARNARSQSEKPFCIVVGETIALTPAMGWIVGLAAILPAVHLFDDAIAFRFLVAGGHSPRVPDEAASLGRFISKLMFSLVQFSIPSNAINEHPNEMCCGD